MSKDIRSFFVKTPKKSTSGDLASTVAADVPKQELAKPAKSSASKRRRGLPDDNETIAISKIVKLEAQVHQNSDFARTLAETKIKKGSDKERPKEKSNTKKRSRLEVLDEEDESNVVVEPKKKKTKSTEDDCVDEKQNRPAPKKTVKKKKRDDEYDKDFIDDTDDPEAVKKSSKAKKTKETTIDSMDFEEQDKLRKRKNAFLSYLNRQGPANPGSKEVPEGAENCFANLKFIATGVMDSLTSDEIRDIVTKYGGKTVSAVSRCVNYIIVGKDPGPAKMQKAKELKTVQLSEDEFLDLIRKLSRPLLKKGARKLSNKKTQPDPVEASKPEIDKVLETGISKLEIDANDRNWVDKYKPKTIKEIIGQFGDKSLAARLSSWLRDWYSLFEQNGKNGRVDYYNWKDDGSKLRAALLSGPPGVGKTTTAYIVAKSLGFDVVEFNASDTRNKNLLTQHVTEVVRSQSLSNFAFKGEKIVTKNRVLIMDEVDGMSGNEDRGGLKELVTLIKSSRMPIICICNDRQNAKLRTLGNYCFDLRFPKPRLDQIKGAMMSICFKEGLKIKPDLLAQIIASTNNDIRQTINYLSLLSADGRLTFDNVQRDNLGHKPIINNPWEITKKILIRAEHSHASFNERYDWFFTDYAAIPLFVQENYSKVIPDVPKNQMLSRMAKTAESLSIGDVFESRIRASNSWDLLASQAVFSCALPSYYVGGQFTDIIGFPAWFGKNSRHTKLKRLLCELKTRFRYRSTSDGLDLVCDVLNTFRLKLLRVLRSGSDGVDKAVEMMHDYYLLRDDFDAILELSLWPNTKMKYEDIDSKVKSTFTRVMNKASIALPYSIGKSVVAKKTKISQEDYLNADDLEALEAIDEDETDDDNIENDTMIKAKKPSSRKKK